MERKRMQNPKLASRHYIWHVKKDIVTWQVFFFVFMLMLTSVPRLVINNSFTNHLSCHCDIDFIDVGCLVSCRMACLLFICVLKKIELTLQVFYSVANVTLTLKRKLVTLHFMLHVTLAMLTWLNFYWQTMQM